MSSLARLLRSWFFVWLLLVMVLVLVSTVGSGYPTATFVPGLEVRDWPTADGGEGNHFSPLSDITPENVRHLEVAWRYRTGDVHAHRDGWAGTAFEATPIVVDGVMYVATPYSRAVALDADTGEELWAFDPGLDRTDQDHTLVTSRGLAHWKDATRTPGTPCAGRVFVAAFDARLFALDDRTGTRCSDFAEGGSVDLTQGVARVEGSRPHFHQTAPPTVMGGLVVVGSSISDSRQTDAPSGVIRAFDARTGDLVWAWEPLLAAGEAGADPVGAANAWATLTADEERDLIFVPTSSPSPDHFGGSRPGDNLYSNSLVALRASTGDVVWHFQTVHHDLWDYDLPSPPALITLERGGARIPAVVQTTKMGYVYVFHRETGEPLFPIEERPAPRSDVPGEVTSPTQPAPLLPPPLTPQVLTPADAWGLTPFDRAACRRRIESLRSDGMFAPPSLRGTIVYPGFIGGMEWGGVGYDEASGLLVTNTNRVAMVATLIPRTQSDAASGSEHGKFSISPQQGTPYAVKREPLLSPLGIPCSPPPWGVLHAVDLRTGRVAWEVPLGRVSDLVGVPTPISWGSPNLGGPLVTGGVVFIGATMDRRLRAFDLATGELLWTARLPASAQSSPLTYRARPGGRQLVVVAAGGHSGMGSSLGDHIVAYALPATDGGGGR